MKQYQSRDEKGNKQAKTEKTTADHLFTKVLSILYIISSLTAMYMCIPFRTLANSGEEEKKNRDLALIIKRLKQHINSRMLHTRKF